MSRYVLLLLLLFIFLFFYQLQFSSDSYRCNTFYFFNDLFIYLVIYLQNESLSV